MEQSKKVYFDNTIYIDSQTKDSKYTHSNNLIVGTDTTVPPNIYKSILKFNSNDWNFTHIDSVYLFIFLEKINFKYSYNGNISILCYPEDITNTESLEDFSKYNSSKRLNLTFPPKAIERYIKIDITSVFTSIYSLNKVYNLILEPYFSADNENSTSLIEFLSNNSKMPPYLVINGISLEKPLNENHDQALNEFKSSCFNFLDELKDLNRNSLDEIYSEIEDIKNFNNDLLTENKNINEILTSEVISKNEFCKFIEKFDLNNNSIANLNKNILNNNSLISSLKNATEKNSSLINKLSDQLNFHDISINNLNTKIKNIDLLTSSLNDNINENTAFINKFSEQLKSNNIAIDTLSTNIKHTDSITSSLATSINTTNNFIEILVKEIDNIKLSVNQLNTKLANTDSIVTSLDNCSNTTLDISKEIKNLNKCLLSLNNNVETDKSILKDLNLSIDELLKFTENITLTSLD